MVQSPNPWTGVFVFISSLFFVFANVSAEDVPPEAQELLNSGDNLAKEGKFDEALLTYKNAYEKIVPGIRHLEFRETVQPRLMNRSELRTYMTSEYQKEYTPEELKLLDRSLKAFGMVPSSVDVKELMISLLTEEVGGFYNPRTKEMYLIREDVKKGNFLSRLIFGGSFDSAEQRVTLSHEMTHALSDQHFDLQSFDKVANGNDDMMMAISALIEGEATLVMMSELLGDPSATVTDIEPERIDMAFRLSNMATPLFGGRTIRGAPSVFRESLIFPYHYGCVFVARLTNREGWDAINRAFHTPPLSTEQILHWEKFVPTEGNPTAERDDPTAVELPKLEEALGGKWKPLGQNTLGEFQTRIMFEESRDSVEAAEGWDGDRYSILEAEDGRLALAWFTTWDSDNDALEFSNVAVPWFTRVAYQSTANDDNPDSLRNVALEASRTWRSASGAGVYQKDFEDRSVFVELRGQDVIVISGLPSSELKQAAESLWQSQKAPLTIRR